MPRLEQANCFTKMTEALNKKSGLSWTENQYAEILRWFAAGTNAGFTMLFYIMYMKTTNATLLELVSGSGANGVGATYTSLQTFLKAQEIYQQKKYGALIVSAMLFGGALFYGSQIFTAINKMEDTNNYDAMNIFNIVATTLAGAILNFFAGTNFGRLATSFLLTLRETTPFYLQKWLGRLSQAEVKAYEDKWQAIRTIAVMEERSKYAPTTALREDALGFDASDTASLLKAGEAAALALLKDHYQERPTLKALSLFCSKGLATLLLLDSADGYLCSTTRFWQARGLNPVVAAIAGILFMIPALTLFTTAGLTLGNMIVEGPLALFHYRKVPSTFRNSVLWLIGSVLFSVGISFASGFTGANLLQEECPKTQFSGLSFPYNPAIVYYGIGAYNSIFALLAVQKMIERVACVFGSLIIGLLVNLQNGLSDYGDTLRKTPYRAFAEKHPEVFAAGLHEKGYFAERTNQIPTIQVGSEESSDDERRRLLA